jgi:hypothetical protein
MTISQVIEENKIKMDFIRLEKNKDNLWTISPVLEDDNDRNRYNRQARRLAFHLKNTGVWRDYKLTSDVIGLVHIVEIR